ncbi:uncharacterized protein LOC133295205 [Gastrolobium bilobum]|uniref:uncharacterized protein LOC133295205 n=1 Tax=Gastrolobium bilobum TaxID=150636 RepID=UPI002AB0A220|nr:uncharacterized protein LOC133295205 [Gastrolobium bilobum]
MKNLAKFMVESKERAPAPVVVTTPVCSLCYGPHAFEGFPSNPTFILYVKPNNAEAQPPNDQWMNRMLQNHEAMLQSHGAILKSLETQIGQIASTLSSRPLGIQPSDTEISKRDGKEVCKALHLRNEREVDQPKPIIRLSTLRRLMDKDEQQGDNTVTAQPSTIQPIPQEEDKGEESTAERVRVALKSRAPDKLMQNIEAHQPIITKAKQILFPLRDRNIGGALCDLGSSIKKMCTSIFKQLGVEASPITVTPQIAYRSLAHHDGKIKNKLVKVYRFIFPADFIIVDFEADKDVPIILDRPFLVKKDAIIDFKIGELTMGVNEENMAFNVLKTINFIDEDVNDYSAISFYDHLVAMCF